jgi:hypothetical protein
MMNRELIWKPGNHEGFQMKQERIRKAGKQEGVSILKSRSVFFSWIPGFQVHLNISTPQLLN